MAKNRKIEVNGTPINIFSFNEDDYISLTDIAKNADKEEPRFVLRNWLSTRTTIAYLGEWEIVHNPNFNRAGYRTVKDSFFENPFSLTPKRWIEGTNAKGIISKSGRYKGGTYAHRDIAINFCYWLSPTFQIYLIKEFQRLKQIEFKERNETLDWNLKRVLSKINYKVHTDAIKEKLIPPKVTKMVGIIYANEADILNMAVFGMTAKQWRIQYPNEKGNIRDNANHYQLLILSNLEAVNAELIRIGMSQNERLEILNEAAIKQMTSLLTSPSISKLSVDKKLK